MKKLFLALVAALVFLTGAIAQNDGAPDEVGSTDLRFIVTKEDNGKPIRNAAVVMHPVKTNGKQEKGGLELKTDADGKASFDGLPYGKLRIQVLAPGFQTFGQDYEINQATMEIMVKMKRPTRQYSIYEDHPNESKDSGNPQQTPPPDPNAKPK